MSTIGKMSLIGMIMLAAPASTLAQETAAKQPAQPVTVVDSANYKIATGDQIEIFVWKNPDLTTTVPVRPDGKITMPLVQDTEAQGKTPTQLAADLTVALSRYIQQPNVTIVVKSFAAPDNAAAIRIIGSAMPPKTVPYRSGLTIMDVIIEIGGLPVFANGNGAQLIREDQGKTNTIPIHLGNLMKGGNIKENVELKPGDIIRIPERMF